MTIINTFAEFQEVNKQYVAYNTYNIGNCEFNIDITINHDNCRYIKFINCIFNNDVKLRTTVLGDAEFIDCEFRASAEFTNSTFESKVRFHKAKFIGTTSFNNTSFEDLADFWNSEFSKPTIFYKTDFKGATVFSSAEFSENVLFTYSLVEKVIIFRGTIFKKGLDLSLAILNGYINTFDLDIDDFDSVEDLDRENDELYEDYISNQAIITDKNKKETFRILKNQLTNQGNNIYSLKFSALELKAYQTSLTRKRYKRKSWKVKVQDFITLSLNDLSNKHGSSWFRGIKFTLGAGLVFFYFSLLSTECYSFGFPNLTWEDVEDNFGYYFKSLSPIHEFDYINANCAKGFFFFWDFIGRTFVAYGIYQTIQAFRKFKK